MTDDCLNRTQNRLTMAATATVARLPEAGAVLLVTDVGRPRHATTAAGMTTTIGVRLHTEEAGPHRVHPGEVAAGAETMTTDQDLAHHRGVTIVTIDVSSPPAMQGTTTTTTATTTIMVVPTTQTSHKRAVVT